MNCPICHHAAQLTSKRGPPYWYECTFCGRPFTAAAESGVVYVIQQDQTWAVKIGFTADLERLASRLKSLQTASPYALRIVHSFKGTIETERVLHIRFSGHRLSGEWFAPSAEMAEWLSIQKAGAARLRELERA